MSARKEITPVDGFEVPKRIFYLAFQNVSGDKSNCYLTLDGIFTKYIKREVKKFGFELDNDSISIRISNKSTYAIIKLKPNNGCYQYVVYQDDHYSLSKYDLRSVGIFVYNLKGSDIDFIPMDKALYTFIQSKVMSYGNKVEAVYFNEKLSDYQIEDFMISLID